MNLELFFRLIIMSIFQSMVTYDKKNRNDDKMSYDNQLFFCPRVYCKDGFNVSLQIHNGNYCSSENGYRNFGYTMQEVEFGFPSMNEEDMFEYSEGYGYAKYDDANNEIPFDKSTFVITGSVGRIPVTVMQFICEKHGGIDWEATISIDAARTQVKR